MRHFFFVRPSRFVRDRFRRIRSRIVGIIAGLWRRHRPDLLKRGVQTLAAGAGVLVVLLIHRELYSMLAQQRDYAVELPGSDTRSTSLDDELVGRIAAALHRNPWIRRVERVERVYPNHIKVRYEFRQPALSVKTRQGYVLLDRDLVRLPGLYPTLPEKVRTLTVEGIREAPPEPGRVWAGSALRPAVELALICSQNELLRRIDIASVDCSRASGPVLLKTRTGCVIHWGRAPSDSGPDELPVARKLHHLRRVLAYYPNLEDLDSVRIFAEGNLTVTLRDRSNARGD